MKQTLQNNVLIIGADHHNTLAVIRCLGRQKCNISVIVHGGFSGADAVRLSRSKYAKGRVVVVEEQENVLLEHLNSVITEKKQILFPCSDFAQYVIDNNRLLLEPNYIMPGFEEPGKCVYLMDKWNQYKFAFNNNIPMAKTWRIDIENGQSYHIPEDITFPCIIKPTISAFGNKSDIAICDNKEKFEIKIAELFRAGYKTLLVQTFLKKQYEVCAYGALLKNADFSVGAIVKKEREFPPRSGGSTTYARFIDDARIVELATKVLKIMVADGYHGQYDIEFFCAMTEFI